MAKISMLIGDAELAEIDGQAGGNRTAFMVAAAVERARALKRRQVDEEIATSLRADEEANADVNREWETTLADGLES
jgi:hypothetical protein